MICARIIHNDCSSHFLMTSRFKVSNYLGLDQLILTQQFEISPQTSNIFQYYHLHNLYVKSSSIVTHHGKRVYTMVSLSLLHGFNVGFKVYFFSSKKCYSLFDLSSNSQILNCSFPPESESSDCQGSK